MSDPPIPDRPNSGEKKNPWVQVGRYSQLAFVLPAATAAGWLIGSGLDRWLHTSWINVVGLLLGTVGGLIDLIHTATRDSQ